MIDDADTVVDPHRHCAPDSQYWCPVCINPTTDQSGLMIPGRECWPAMASVNHHADTSVHVVLPAHYRGYVLPVMTPAKIREYEWARSRVLATFAARNKDAATQERQALAS